MQQQEIIDSLLQQAWHDAKAAKSMFQSGHYDWCLFLWYIVIEKTLEALIVARGEAHPFIHDLEKLASHAKLQLTNEQKAQLKEITTFNLDARYDDFKLSFYKKATKDFCQTWCNSSEEMHAWLLKQF